MTPERFETELRRRLNQSGISVRRDAAWAVAHGFHRDAIQVWDKAPRSGEPYCFFVCQRGGIPVEPCEDMIRDIILMSAESTHRGRKGWASDVERREKQRAEDGDRAVLRNADRRFKEAEIEDRLMHATHNHRAFAVKAGV